MEQQQQNGQNVNSNNENRKGVKAEERPATTTSYVQTLNAYVASYLPTSIKRRLPTIITPGSKFSNEDRDVILSATFGTLELKHERRLCLLLTYTNGFQVWDVQNSQNVQEILSKREGSIKAVHFVANPDSEKEGSPLFGKRPLLAVLSAADAAAKFPNTMIKLYSTKENKYVNMLRFKTEVCNFLSSKRVFVVALADRLHGFDNASIEKMFTLSCFPSPTASPVSLGHRWIAYAAAETAPSVPNQDSLGEYANKMKDWASSLYSFGKKTISEYMYADDDPNKQTQPTSNQANVAVSNPAANAKLEEAVGTIAVYDIITQKVIAHFKAHSHAISITRFDPSGTLLATASEEGHVVNVFLLNTNPSGSVHYNYQHLYKLQRGYTNATLQEISFNIDSKWVNVTSSRGTTHIFAINRTGGTPNVYTHLREFRTKADAVPIPFTNAKTVTLSPACRIHQTPVVDDYLGKTQIASNSTSVFYGSPLETEYLYVMSQTGVLTQYTMKSHRPKPTSDMDPSTLELTVEPNIEMDVCRKNSWPEIEVEISDPPSPGLANNGSDKAKWLSEVEIVTRSNRLTPTWAKPQFSLKALQLEDPKAYFSQQTPYFAETVPTVHVQVQKDEISAKQQEKMNFGEFYSEMMPSRVSESQLQDNILSAMSTPIGGVESVNIQDLSLRQKEREPQHQAQAQAQQQQQQHQQQQPRNNQQQQHQESHSNKQEESEISYPKIEVAPQKNQQQQQQHHKIENNSHDEANPSPNVVDTKSKQKKNKNK